MTDYTLGDFGGSGPRSAAGDDMIDKQEMAEDVAIGEWEYEVHTENAIAWHIPGTAKTVQLWYDDPGWILKRAGQQRGPRQETLAEAFDLAAEYMDAHPGGVTR